MSEREFIDLVLFAWSAGVTLFLLCQVRSLSAIVGVLRDGGALGASSQAEWRGPLVGSEAPALLTSRLSSEGLSEGRVLAVLASAGCGACEQLLEDLGERESFPVPLAVIFNGAGGSARALAERCASLIVDGSDGVALHAALGINATPGIVGIHAGLVDASALATRGIRDIDELANPSTLLKAQVS